MLDYVPQLYGMVARSGYSIRLFDAVVKEIEQEYQHPLSTVDPLGRLAGRSGPAAITVFKSVGTALEDLVAAKLVHAATASRH